MDFKKLTGVLIFIMINAKSFGQDCDPGGAGLPPVADQPDPCDLPLDTYVYVLVIAAVIFGAYQLYKKQKALPA